MICIYCGKKTEVTDNLKQPVCVDEYVCEGIPVPTLEEQFGDDPTGRNWSHE